MTAQAVHVLLVTHDDLLWRHWEQLDAGRWTAVRGRTLDDLKRWQHQGRRLAVLDSGLPDLPGWGDSQTWQPLLKDVRLLVASTSPSDEEGKQALSLGASGYAHAYAPAEALGRILTHVSAGDIWMGRTLVTRLLREIDSRLSHRTSDDWANGLTQREVEVAQRAAMGDSNQAIADELGITERTVRAHLSAVFDKLGVADRLMLALKVHGIQ